MMKRAIAALLVCLFTLCFAQTPVRADGGSPLDGAWTKDGVPFAVVQAENGADATAYTQGGEVPLGDTSALLIHIAFAQLMEQGKVSADGTVQNVLGQDCLAHWKPTADAAGIPMSDLLNHTVGWENDWRELDGEYSVEAYVQAAEPRMLYKLGEVKTAARYSDMVKALICEKVSGMAFDAYVRESILTPLGMNDTRYEKNGAWAYSGLISTGEDLAKLLNSLTHGGEGLFAKESTFAWMIERSYGVHPLMPGLARGLKEYPARAYCLGLDAGDKAAFGGLRFFPEEGTALWIAAGNLKGTDEQHFPERMLTNFTGEREMPPVKENLPLTAPMAGEFIRADRPDGGYMELARDMVGLQIIKSKPYTEYATNKLYVFSTYYSSQYLNTFRGFTNLYFNTVDQIDDQLFRDVYGNLMYFITDENGRVVKFAFEDEEYIPAPATRSIGAVNVTIWVLYLCMLFFAVNLVVQTIMLIRDKLSYWPVFTTSWLAFALCVTELLLGVNVCMLLYYSYRTLSYGVCQAHLVINWVLTALALGEIAAMAFFWKKSELRPHEKGVYIASMAALGLFFCLMLWWGLF